MNIFALDRDPYLAAKYIDDKRCVKMILESFQLLATAHRFLDGFPIKDLTPNGRRITRYHLADGKLDTILRRF
jgi:hypothetical protein